MSAPALFSIRQSLITELADTEKSQTATGQSMAGIPSPLPVAKILEFSWTHLIELIRPVIPDRSPLRQQRLKLPTPQPRKLRRPPQRNQPGFIAVRRQVSLHAGTNSLLGSSKLGSDLVGDFECQNHGLDLVQERLLRQSGWREVRTIPLSELMLQRGRPAGWALPFHAIKSLQPFSDLMNLLTNCSTVASWPDASSCGLSRMAFCPRESLCWHRMARRVCLPPH